MTTQTQTNGGVLLDRQDQILEHNCTLEDALDWLRKFNAESGWRGGQVFWLPDDDEQPCIIIEDAAGGFAQRT